MNLPLISETLAAERQRELVEEAARERRAAAASGHSDAWWHPIAMMLRRLPVAVAAPHSPDDLSRQIAVADHA